MTRADGRVDLRQVDALVAAEHREGQVGGARLVGVGHRGVAVLLELERLRPAVLDRVAQAVQRADAGIAAPGEDELLRRSPCRSAGRRSGPASCGSASGRLRPWRITSCAGGEGDQVREALHGDACRRRGRGRPTASGRERNSAMRLTPPLAFQLVSQHLARPAEGGVGRRDAGIDRRPASAAARSSSMADAVRQRRRGSGA